MDWNRGKSAVAANLCGNEKTKKTHTQNVQWRHTKRGESEEKLVVSMAKMTTIATESTMPLCK